MATLKRIFCAAVTAALLFTAAHAEDWLSIADMPQPPRWTATFQAGKFTVEVDVQPTIPDVDALPVLKAVPEADAMQGSWLALVGSFETTSKSMGSGILYPPLDENAPCTPSGLTLAMGKAVAAEAFADMGENGCDLTHIDHVKRFYTKTADAITVRFFATLRGVPLWGHAIDSVRGCADNELVFYPHYNLTYQDAENYRISGYTVLESAVLAEDVPLCSFDRVRETIQAEIEAGHIRAVYAVDLGYALYNEPGATREPGLEWLQTAEFYVVPAWRVLCLYTADAGKALPASAYASPYTSLYELTLYVNAQTGELLDPTQRGNDCAPFTGFLSWEDVQ